MRRGFVLGLTGVVVGLVTLVLMLTRPGPVAGPAASEERSATSSPSPTYPPPVVKDCWVPTPDGNVSLTGDEAKSLTTAAAGLPSTDSGERRLRRIVDDRVEVTSAQAQVVAATLLGSRPTHRLTCGYVRLGVEPQRPGTSGLTPRARALREAWTEVFGQLTAGGFARGGVSTGHLDSSAHYEGRAIDVFFRPYDDPAQRRLGRVFAQWLVAHAQDFHVLSVIYSDQIWTSWASYAGWRPYVHPSGDRRNPVLRHLDHVHVAVESGEPWRGR